jgi:hypothetical protein
LIVLWNVRDLCRGEVKRRAWPQHTRYAGDHSCLVAACQVEHHAPRDRPVERVVREWTEARVAADDSRRRKVDAESLQHSAGAVESDHAVASIQQRARHGKTVAAAEIQNTRAGR